MTRTDKISQQTTENSNGNNGNDDDLLYEIECCNPSDNNPDKILLSLDEESDGKSDDMLYKLFGHQVMRYSKNQKICNFNF